MAEEGVIRLLYRDPQLFDNVPPLSPEEFSVPALGNMYRVLSAQSGGAPSMATLSGSLSADEIALLTILLQKPETTANGRKALSDYIEIMQTERQAQEQSEDLLSLAKNLRKKKGYTDQDGN